MPYQKVVNIPMTSLELASYETTPTFHLTECMVKVIDVYDADTVRLAVPVGDSLYNFPVRLLGMDAPEIRPRGRDAQSGQLERSAARHARKRMVELVTGTVVEKHEPKKKTRRRCAANRKLLRLVPRGFDKYGRVLAELFDGEQSINQQMIQEGYVRTYDGGARQAWDTTSLETILRL